MQWDEALACAARKHAEAMADANLLAHQLPGEPDLKRRARDAGASFSHITENIARGQDAFVFHNGWMHSPGHRANILDPEADSAGIAVLENGEQLFAVEDFARSVKPLPIEEQERRIGALLIARGLQVIKAGDDARKTCALDRGFAGRRKPRYVAVFETPDLSHLPDALENVIRSGHYTSASIGACPPRMASGFTSFRIAVLL